MKKLKICLCVLLSVLLAGGILTPVLAEDETPAAAASTEITDLFSIDLFSNAEVNNFLCVFPAFCGELEKNLAAMLEQEVPFAQDMSSMTVEGRIRGYFNVERGTDKLGEVLHASGIDVYPYTLGQYLSAHQYPAVGNRLSAKGYDWTAVSDADGRFDFDWGLDAITDPAQRYNRFINVISTLIGAAYPVFRSALGTQQLSLHFNGEDPGQSLLYFVITSGCYRLSISLGSSTGMELSLAGTELGKVEGVLTFDSMDLYQKVLLPLYRSLGIGTVFPYSFPDLNTSSPASTARTLYDPLYTLMTKVQSDPDVCRSLISFYQSEEGMAMVNGIGSELTRPYTLSCRITDLTFMGGNDATASLLQWDWMTNLFCGTLANCYNYAEQSPAEHFMSVQTLVTQLGEKLPALTFTEAEEPSEPETPSEPATEPETPTEPATEPATETPEEEGGSNPFLDFLKSILNCFRRLIEWIKNLFQFS